MISDAWTFETPSVDRGTFETPSAGTFGTPSVDPSTSEIPSTGTFKTPSVDLVLRIPPTAVSLAGAETAKVFSISFGIGKQRESVGV